MKLSEELQARGLIENMTHAELEEKLNQGGLKFYVGFDPTADSLHVGQLALFNLMGILQKAGHEPLGLAGGATGMIGDPGGKSAERNLLSPEQIAANIQGIVSQINLFLKGSTEVVNNADWLGKFSYIEFLRDVGKHFSVNQMVTRDSIKSRLEGNGISYTEFSYMLLQAYDFYELNQSRGVTLQVGGSDQWGNIVSGIDLSRRMGGADPLYGLTMPLITKSDGSKFGKSEKGTIWLSAEKTSPYAFYQFFLRQADEDVIRFLKVFTEVPLAEIEDLAQATLKEPHLRKAQQRLAAEVTGRVHGPEQLAKAIQASKVLFGAAIENLDDPTLSEIFAHIPGSRIKKATLEQGWSLIDALVETGACASKGQARKLIEQGGTYVNNQPQGSLEYRLTLENLASETYLVLRTGKKNYRLVEVV